MKVVILGARGMLGRGLCEVFSDIDMVAWDKNDLDITDAAAVQHRLEREGPDVIINAAGYTDVDGAETHREAAFAVNAQAVQLVAAAAKSLDAVLVHYSTDYVFPGIVQQGYSEEDEAGPAVNVYGESKLAGELALREETQAFYLVRTAWLYGPGGSHFVDTMLQLARNHDVLKVVNDQHGSPTFTKDVAFFTRQVLDDDLDYGVYHAVNSGVTTWYGFAKEIFKQAGIGIKLEPVTAEEFERPAKRPRYSVLKNTGGPKMRSWQEALYEYMSSVV